jgi:hypothetical protein
MITILTRLDGLALEVMSFARAAASKLHGQSTLPGWSHALHVNCLRRLKLRLSHRPRPSLNPNHSLGRPPLLAKHKELMLSSGPRLLPGAKLHVPRLPKDVLTDTPLTASEL